MKIEATEINDKRRTARISRLDGITNEVKRKMGMEGRVTEGIERKLLKWCGNVK